MNIVVLAGGLSTERDVSLSTGSMVCRALREIGHKALLLDVFLGLTLDHEADLAELFTCEEKPTEILKVPSSEPDLDAVRNQRQDGGRSFFGPNVLELCKAADIVFIALHGICGEDGRIQAAMELFGIPYTGTSSLGSALAMNKDMSKRLFFSEGIPTAKWVTIDSSSDLDDTLQEFGLPCVVKPANGGSSIGVFIPKTAQEFRENVEEALKYDEHIIIEEYIKGREFSVGILDGEPLPVIEIVPHDGFYDYKNKYQTGCTDEICPAHLSKSQRLTVQRLALKAHQALMLGSYSRVDFMLDANGRFVCLEANTLPGMTPTSLLPKEAKADDLSYNELCWRIIVAGKSRILI